MSIDTSLDKENASTGISPLSGRFAAVKRRLPVIGLATLSVAALSLAVISLRAGVSVDQRLSHTEKQQNVIYTQALAKSDLEPLQKKIDAQGAAIKLQQAQIEQMRKSLTAAADSGLPDAVSVLRQSVVQLTDSQTALQSRQAALEQSVTVLQQTPQKAQQATPEKKAEPEAKKPAPAKSHRAVKTVARKAPFVLTGVEKRGTTSFAAIAPPGFRSLSEIRLIGEGQTISGWTLINTGYGQAQFRVNGRVTTLNVR